MIEIVNILINLIEYTKNNNTDRKDMVKFKKMLEQLEIELLNVLALIKKLQMDNGQLLEEKRELEYQIRVLNEQIEMKFD
jgi:hypothetical protein